VQRVTVSLPLPADGRGDGVLGQVMRMWLGRLPAPITRSSTRGACHPVFKRERCERPRGHRHAGTWGASGRVGWHVAYTQGPKEWKNGR
jgi:hypothetical protein